MFEGTGHAVHTQFDAGMPRQLEIFELCGDKPLGAASDRFWTGGDSSLRGKRQYRRAPVLSEFILEIARNPTQPERLYTWHAKGRCVCIRDYLVRDFRSQGTIWVDVLGTERYNIDTVDQRIALNQSIFLEIIEQVKYCPMDGEEPFRPDIELLRDSDIGCDDYVLQCMEDCWTENPEYRPDFITIRSRLKRMKDGK